MSGLVQGVGFRPFVYRLARRLGLCGWVRNTASGVEIRAEGTEEALAAFVRALSTEAPPRAHVDSVQVQTLDSVTHCDGFEILPSLDEVQGYPHISPDIATCPDCLKELLDPGDRRYRYPFTNCTNCGPRFTIITAMPYDRASTTMAGFRMCPACQREYDDPLDRRFHAQPNACPVCGPHLSLTDPSGNLLAERDRALLGAAERLLEGQIVAIKGLGGYQLACDANNAQAVALLRQKKHRPDKAFAVMVADTAMADTLCVVTAKERRLLQGPAAPIVLCRRRAGAPVADAVAPGMYTLGVMLPATPLHHLLLREVRRPLIMTSGNLSEEPIAQDNEEALERLGALCDAFLMHNRPVHSRYDDSVWFVAAGEPQPVRRARGDAPEPITLAEDLVPTLALGAELKGTFTLARGREAFVSQHLGDMENLETLEHQRATLELYQHLFRIAPEHVACDLHPDYATTRMARSMGLPLVQVQHHHAHLASVLAERGMCEPVIGVIWDGTGYGLDGTIWGGEFLLGDARGFARVAHLGHLPLPGGDSATRRPYRIAWSWLAEAMGEAEATKRVALPPGERAMLASMLASGAGVVRTSSMGRFFDAVSALLGVRREVTYEGQAAMELETLACSGDAQRGYRWSTECVGPSQCWGRVDAAPQNAMRIGTGELLAGILADMDQGVAVEHIARRLHLTLAELLVAISRQISQSTGISTVALSGGVFQNRLLLELALPRLRAAGLTPLVHRLVPTNDGGLSLGQALVAHYATAEKYAFTGGHDRVSGCSRSC
ncbi:MAG: carbamoyltransferase HypF [Anaerolineae bacterium]